MTCLYEASEKQDLDLKTELFKYEAQLIDIKTLKDSSIASYTHIFETVAQNGAFPFPKKFEYSAKGLTPEVLHQLNEDCREGRSLGFINSLAKEINDRLELDKDLKELSQKLENFDQIEDLTEMAEIMVLIYKLPYFDQEFLRINALSSFYLYTYQYYSPEEYKIIIDIDENSVVYINEEEVAHRDIYDKIKEITTNLTEEELETLQVGMRVNREAKIGVVTHVKLALRDADARKVNYMSVK